MSRITILIDPSSAKESDCLYKFRIMNMEGWRKEFQKSSLTFGSACHRAIAHRLKGRIEKTGEDGKTYVDNAAPSIDDIIRDAVMWYVTSKTEMGKSDFRTPKNLTLALKGYFETYAYEPFQTTPDMVELPFAYPFYVDEALDVEFILCGVVDRLGHMQGVPFMFQDTKTSSTNSPDTYLREYETSFQMMTYSWVTRQMFELAYYPPYQIDGIFMKGNYKTGETGIVYKRSEIIDPRPDLVEEHMEWFLSKCKQIATAVREGKMLRNFARCMTTYGACEFYKICTTQEAFRENIFRNDFIQKKYDPATFGE